MMPFKRRVSELTENGMSGLVCKYCTFSTFNIDILDEHIAQTHEHHKDGEHKGKVVIKRRRRGRKSELSLSGEDLYKCSLCSYTTKRKFDMPKHLIGHCPLDTITMYKCSQCSYETKRKNDMPKHMLAHCSDVQMFKCPECPYQTKRKNDLPKHLLCHKPADSVPIYRCEYCDYFTKRKGDLPKHLLNHEEKSNMKMFHCTECRYQTKRMNDLNKHMLVHSDRQVAGVFKCLKCQYATDKVHKFSKHLLANCETWGQIAKLQAEEDLSLEDMLESADREGVHILLDGEEFEQQPDYVDVERVDQPYHGQYEGYAGGQPQYIISTLDAHQENSSGEHRERNAGVFRLELGEFAVTSDVASQEQDKLAENANNCGYIQSAH